MCVKALRSFSFYTIGVVGGTNIDSYGGGVDYLCLSKHPQWPAPKSSSTTFDDDNPRFNDVEKEATNPEDDAKEVSAPFAPSLPVIGLLL